LSDARALLGRLLGGAERSSSPGADAQELEVVGRHLQPGQALQAVAGPQVQRHAPAERKILEAGKHMVVEKPIATTMEEADELVELANKKGLTYVVAPPNMRGAIIERIDREIEQHKAQGGGRIIFKMNSLVDREVIRALYAASMSGVPYRTSSRPAILMSPPSAAIDTDSLVRTSTPWASMALRASTAPA